MTDTEKAALAGEKVRAKLQNLFNAPTGTENRPTAQQHPRFLPHEDRAEWRKANAVTLRSGAMFPSYQPELFRAKRDSTDLSRFLLDDYSPSPREYTEPDILMKVLEQSVHLESKTSLSSKADKYHSKTVSSKTGICHSRGVSSSSYGSMSVQKLQPGRESPRPSHPGSQLPATPFLRAMRKLRVSSSSPGAQGASSSRSEPRIARLHSSSSRQLSSMSEPRIARYPRNSSSCDSGDYQAVVEAAAAATAWADNIETELEAPGHRCPTAHTYASSYQSCQTSMNPRVLESATGTQAARCNAISDKTDASTREIRGKKSSDRKSSRGTASSLEPSVLELPSPITPPPVQKPDGKGRLQKKGKPEDIQDQGQCIAERASKGREEARSKQHKQSKNSLFARAKKALSLRRQRIRTWLRKTRRSWQGVDVKAELRERKKRRHTHAPLLRPVRSVFGLRNISSDTVVVDPVEKGFGRRASEPALRSRYSVFSFRSGRSTRRGRS